MFSSRIPFFFAMFLCAAIAIVSYRFLLLELGDAFPVMTGHIEDRRIWLILHVSAAPIALFTGILQFLPRLRAKRPAVHRWTGRLYGVSILIGGVAGFFMALGAEGGAIAALGFGSLAVLWILFTAQAIRMAMARRFDAHRRWMYRSFALSFAAVTLRLMLPIFMAAGHMSYPEATVYVAWLCWVPNLIFTEWMLRKKRG